MCWKKNRKYRRRFKDIWLKKFPSQEYYKAWDQSFLPFMDLRATVCFFCKMLILVLNLMSGKSIIQLSNKYVADGGAHNKDFNEQFGSLIVYSLICLYLLVVLLIGLSIKWPRICRYYELIQVFLKSVESALPLGFEHASFGLPNTLLYTLMCHNDTHWIRDTFATCLYCVVRPFIAAYAMKEPLKLGLGLVGFS